MLIRLEILDYKNYSLDLEITKYVNKNIEDVMRVLLDYIEDLSEFEIDFFFPRDYLLKKPQECKNNLYELYEVIKSESLREFIKPKYKYSLYAILEWWEDIVDSEEELLINKPDNLLINKIKDVYYDEDGEYIINSISDFYKYIDIIFEDLDFLPDTLSEIVTLYLSNQVLVERVLQYNDLDDFIDLMECDLRERYLDVRNLNKSKD